MLQALLGVALITFIVFGLVAVVARLTLGP
jgi:hypothetical protein